MLRICGAFLIGSLAAAHQVDSCSERIVQLQLKGAQIMNNNAVCCPYAFEHSELQNGHTLFAESCTLNIARKQQDDFEK